MTSLLAYRAKRALIDRIDTLLASDTVQVSYAFPGDPMRLCVYGGGLRFAIQDAVAEGVLSLETDTIDVWVRCYQPGDDSREADTAVEDLAGQIVDDLAQNPKLIGGAMSITGVVLGDAGLPQVTPGPEPAVTSQLLLQVVCEAHT